MAELFGFTITKNKPQEQPVSFVPKDAEDGAMVVSEGGVYGTYVDLDGAIRTESELVNKYREMAQVADVDIAIDDIVNEAIVQDNHKAVVSLNLDNLNQPDNIKKIVQEEFKNVLKLLEFESLSYECFRKWYVDGRLYYHAIINEKDPRAGITELRYIDPRKIRKVREVKRKKINQGANSTTVQQEANEYYVYSEKGFAKAVGTSGMVNDGTTTGLKIAKDSIVYVTSGLTNVNGDLVLSYLHKALKPLNQLRTLEDSLVIYRISRAPERRIFYIDVGNLPKMKAEQYLRDIMTRFKNKVVYDSSTGEIRDDRKFMTMLEDFWLPRREGGKGTEITTLPGGQNLGQIDDILYFQKKLYKSLNVPTTRLESEGTWTFGRSGEITRDEIKFSKFVKRLRSKFSTLFTKVLEKQLILKGVITVDEWSEFKQSFKYQYAEDNNFEEVKDTEILNDRMNALRNVDDFAGKYYSHVWIRKNILRQSDEEIQEIDDQIEQESQNQQYNPVQETGIPSPQETTPTKD